MAVEWGRAHQYLDDIEAIGIDEIQWQRGHWYLTLVYQIDAGCRQLLWIGKKWEAKTLLLKRSENLARNKNRGWQNCFSTTCVRCEPTC